MKPQLLLLILCLAAPGCAAQPFAGDGVSGFWITLGSPTATGSVVFLFGAFCALWAQNTGRNPWLWFFLGVLFNVITVLVLLARNAADRDRGAQGRPGG